jgi:hypothetical protein
MKNHHVFTVAALLAAVICWSYPSGAGVFRQGASYCTGEVANSDGLAQLADGRIDCEGGAGTSAAHAICPLLSGSGFFHDQLTTLNVHGNDFSTVQQFGIKACTARWDTFGLACGTEFQTGLAFTGDFTATPDRSALQSHGSDFPFLHIIIPAPSGGSVSTLRGWFGSAP